MRDDIPTPGSLYQAVKSFHFSRHETKCANGGTIMVLSASMNRYKLAGAGNMSSLNVCYLHRGVVIYDVFPTIAYFHITFDAIS